MVDIIKSPRNTILLLITSFIVGAIILLNAPAEQKLGSGITSIYVHVAFIWSGMSLLTVSIFLGIVVTLNKSAMLQSWTQTIAMVGLFAFLLGLILSIVAAYTNWGGFLPDEPRLITSYNVVAIVIITLVLTRWIANIRIRGFLHIIPGVFILQNVFVARLVLHPPTPTVAVSVTSIQMVFFVLFGICMLCCTWLVVFIQCYQFPVLSLTSDSVA